MVDAVNEVEVNYVLDVRDERFMSLQFFEDAEDSTAGFQHGETFLEDRLSVL